jgi:hypothetical protein
MRPAARLHSDCRRWELGEEVHDVASAQLPSQHDLPRRVDGMHLKKILGQVQSNCRHRLHGCAPSLRLDSSVRMATKLHGLKVDPGSATMFLCSAERGRFSVPA